KIQRIIRNTRYVLAIELMLGCQALDFKNGKKPGTGVKAAYDLIRTVVPYIEKDTIMYPYVRTIFDMITNESIRSAVEKTIGPLEEPEDYEKP
ncbi:aromatic amino acid lyase, partial [Patescibacteria group bacterium]|nr:aromatic amino acid lyase [Patescibacteria group bacterium]